MEIGTIVFAVVILALSVIANYLYLKYIGIYQLLDQSTDRFGNTNNIKEVLHTLIEKVDTVKDESEDDIDKEKHEEKQDKSDEEESEDEIDQEKQGSEEDTDDESIDADDKATIIGGERISGNLSEVTNHFIEFMEALGTDHFTQDLIIFINKIVYDNSNAFVTDITYEDISKMDIKEVYTFLLKVLRKYYSAFETLYCINLENKIEYKVTKSETNLIKMRESLWGIIQDIREYLNDDKKKTLKDAMNIMSEFFNSKGFSDLTQNLTQDTLSENNMHAEEVIEPVVLALSDKEQNILDEINDMSLNTGLKAADAELVTELEKKLEASGLI